MSALGAFFQQIRPFLLGESSAQELMGELQEPESPKALSDLAYYRQLIDRNFHKILRDLYAPVRKALMLEYGEQGGARWSAFVREYARTNPCAHHDPNELGRTFGDFLGALPKSGGTNVPFLDELADYCWIRHLASTAPEHVTDARNRDGIDRRLFVRQYSAHVPNWAGALQRDESPSVEAAPTIVLVYRDLRDWTVRTYYPTLAALKVLAARQGKLQPGTAVVDGGVEHLLIEQGILVRDESENKHET